MKLAHRVHTSASPAQVWELLGSPERWPSFDLMLHRVRGASGRAVAGQHLLGISRGMALRIPVDVVESVAEQRLRLVVRTVPGVTQEETFELTPAVRSRSRSAPAATRAPMNRRRPTLLRPRPTRRSPRQTRKPSPRRPARKCRPTRRSPPPRATSASVVKTTGTRSRATSSTSTRRSRLSRRSPKQRRARPRPISI